MPTSLTDDELSSSGLAAAMLEKATVTTAFLKSLSHPARLVLLCRLAEGPATVGQLETVLDLPQAEVSKQLARLRADDLVTATRDGRNMTYSLREARTVRIIQLLYAEFCT
ncbi:MAG: metalloregulator ArsR/SmtB family transcription factor [bacterium]